MLRRAHRNLRCVLVPSGLAAVLTPACLLTVLSGSAFADDTRPERWREVWSGAEISSSVWLAYAGGTLSPYVGIHEQGLKLRAVTGYGQYEYEDDLGPGDRPSRPPTFSVDTMFAEALVGYLWRFDPLTAKAFVGISAIGHDVSPFDNETIVSGEEVGVKGVVELWLNMGPNAWSSLDLAWSTAFDTRSVRMRSGYRVWPQLSLGAEAGLNIDAQGECKMAAGNRDDCRIRDGRNAEPTDLLDYGKVGVFARYEWEGGEVSVSTGALGQVFTTGGDIEYDPYVTVNWITQF